MVSSTLRPHFIPGKEPVPILHEAGWAPGPVWTGGKSRPHWDSILDRPARGQSLYRLSYSAHKIPDIVEVIKSSRMRCVGHVARMDDEVHKKILWTNPEGQRGRGRPKSRWIDKSEEDARKLGCRIWLAVAHDRGRCRHLLQEAEAHPGL